MQSHFTPDALAELGATLRSFSTPEASAVLNDYNFIASAAHGYIDNLAVAAQRIAKHMRRQLVEAKLRSCNSFLLVQCKRLLGLEIGF